MAVLPLPPPDTQPRPRIARTPGRRAAPDDFRDSEPTALELAAAPPARAQLVADIATLASRLESLLAATVHSYDDSSTGRISDLPRKSQRVMDLLTVSQGEAKHLLALAYELLADVQRG